MHSRAEQGAPNAQAARPVTPDTSITGSIFQARDVAP
jgi:hypothetical protein